MAKKAKNNEVEVEGFCEDVRVGNGEGANDDDEKQEFVTIGALSKVVLTTGEQIARIDGEIEKIKGVLEDVVDIQAKNLKARLK